MPNALTYYLLAIASGYDNGIALQEMATFVERIKDFQIAHQCVIQTLNFCKKIQVDNSVIANFLESFIANNPSCFNAEENYLIGCCYEKGSGLEHSFKKAYQFYQLAAENGNHKAQYKLGHFFELGKGINQSFSHAFFHYQLAAEHEVLESLVALGRCFELGVGTEKSLAGAFECYKKAANQEYIYSFPLIAKAYKNGWGGNRLIRKAKEYRRKYIAGLKELALYNDSEALFHLGLLYKEGLLIKKSLKKAIDCLNKAADLNNVVAQRTLGEYYADGIGVEASEEKSYHFYRMAADHHDVQASYDLAIRCLEGKGMAQSHVFAANLFRKAATEDFHGSGACTEAKFELARLYEQGRGVEKSSSKAFYYYHLAAGEGHIKAREALENAESNDKQLEEIGYEQYKLGEFYYIYQNSQEDIDDAIYYLRIWCQA